MISRNVIALLLLGTIEDHALAVDVAIHFLYSAFFPYGYRLKIQQILIQQATALQEGKRIHLGKKGSLCVALSPETIQLMMLTLSNQVLTPEKAQAGYNDIRMDPSRQDYRDRMYAGLKPSHRVAFQEYRQFGILLPFGAPSAHFNWPNGSLFDIVSGEWLLSDYADPLESYNIEEVIAAGKRHGATVEDIYGCLYFYLSDLLRSFKERLDVLEIKITIHSDPDIDFAQIPNAIKSGKFSNVGIPSTTQFDRVFLSNLIDANYMGLKGLQGWASLLASTPHAAILGYFMNWMTMQPDGTAKDAGEEVGMAILKKSKILQSILRGAAAGGNPEDIRLATLDLANNLDPFYDNSSAFRKYLSKVGVDDICRQLRLKQRVQHKVLPNRIGVPAGRPQKALPEFKDEDDAYYAMRLQSHTWCERYIEFVRA